VANSARVVWDQQTALQLLIDAHTAAHVGVRGLRRHTVKLGEPGEVLASHAGASGASGPKYKTPRHVAFLDAMPKTLIGKIIKKELRRMAAEQFG
jgi:non-ribosomal peptide synthetase component E (peptide arylation enzyme)